MKLKQYLNENENENARIFYEETKNSCKKYYDYIRKSKKSINDDPKLCFLYRGVSSDKLGNNFYKKFKSIKTMRKPKYISKQLHFFMDKWFKDNFGWNVRSQGLFTGKYKLAKKFGLIYSFFPVGDFKYVWSDSVIQIYHIYDNYEENMKNNLIQELKKYKDKNLEKIFKDEYPYAECVVNCDSYYLVKNSILEHLLNYILGE
jgi:hypothetical protein